MRGRSGKMEPLGAITKRLAEREPPRVTDTDPALPDVPTSIDGLPYCETCRGFRWVKRDIKNIHDPAFGQPVPCPDCGSIVAQKRLARLIGELPRKYRDWTLESLVYHAHALGETSQADTVEDIRTNWIDTEESLYLWSREPSRGKTGIAVGLYKIFAGRGLAVAFKDVSDLLQEIRDSFHSREAFEEDGRDFIARLDDADVLFLDDLGTSNPTGWVREALFRIINRRHADSRRTVFTSNFDTMDLVGQLGGDRRVPERIEEMCANSTWVVHLRGGNLRQKPEAF